MSHEYNLSGNVPALDLYAKVKDFFISQAGLRLVEADESSAAFRCSDYLHETQWPYDIEIIQQEQGVYICMTVMNATMLENLVSFLADTGIDFYLEEL